VKIWHYQTFWLVVTILIAFAIGMATDHVVKTKKYGNPNHQASGSSMSPTFESGDWLIVKPLGHQDPIKPNWIIAFWYKGDRNVKRVAALSGQPWEGKLVPEGYVAVRGDCLSTTERLPFIPRGDIYGVVTGVRYSEFWVAPDGRIERVGDTTPTTPTPQPPRLVGGAKVVRVDRNCNMELTSIGLGGDVTSYYRSGMWIVEESTARAYRITDVGLDIHDSKNHPRGMTRLMTKPCFDSAVTGGRVALLQGPPPKNIATFFRTLY